MKRHDALAETILGALVGAGAGVVLASPESDDELRAACVIGAVLGAMLGAQIAPLSAPSLAALPRRRPEQASLPSRARDAVIEAEVVEAGSPIFRTEST